MVGMNLLTLTDLTTYDRSRAFFQQRQPGHNPFLCGEAGCGVPRNDRIAGGWSVFYQKSVDVGFGSETVISLYHGKTNNSNPTEDVFLIKAEKGDLTAA